jgi:protoporphyrinogen oxidase
MHVVVLGAGLAGLATAYELCKAGHRVTILEKEDYAGGMAISWKTEEYWLDHGPHRFHSRDDELIRHIYEVLDDDVVVRDRLSRIYMQGRFFHYPLKAGNVLRNLPPHILVKALFDYAAIRVRQWFKPIPDDNFENWTLKRFGRTLYEIFFGTYTAKAWKMPCTEISADWASQRISQANLWDAIVKTLRPPKGGEVRSLVSEFWYPGHGGIGAIGRKYAEKVVAAGAKLHLESPLKRVEIEGERAKRVVYEHAGVEHVVECDEVVNTIPLPRVLECFSPPIDAATKQAIANLKYIGIVFVYLEIDQPSVSPDHWVYLPEKHLTIHRISEFKNFSDDSAPGNKTVVCCEITCRWGDEHWNLTLEEGARIAERDLVNVGLIKPGISRGIDLRRLAYAYPVYDLTYKHNLDALKRAARKVKNFQTTGRQGLYRYNNMDHSIAMGRRIAKTLVEGRDARADEVADGKEYFG